MRTGTRTTLFRIAALALVLFALTGSFAYGYLVAERRLPPYPSMRRIYNEFQGMPAVRNAYYWVRDRILGADHRRGRWHVGRQLASDQPLTRHQQEMMTQLAALGYVSGSMPATRSVNVTVFQPELAFEGLNLYNSGHAPEAVLIDMTGRVLHRWSYVFRDAFPDSAARAGIENLEHWRRVHLYENGDLLAIYEGFGLIKLDRDSNLIWANDLAFHHDVFVDDEGLIYGLTHELMVLPRIHEYEPLKLDSITILTDDGRLVRQVPLLEAFERSPYASFLGTMPEFGDVFHTNTIEVLDGTQAHRSPAFAKGNILISVRHMSVIAIVDTEAEQVVWALAGQWKGQHQPTFLEQGNILLFDNHGHGGRTKVIEFDPFTQAIVWSYDGSPQTPLYSHTCGSNQRLPNGNTLITESNQGRALEVTPDRRVAWEYFTPHRAGENGELVATLFEVVRLPPAYVAAWLEVPEER